LSAKVSIKVLGAGCGTCRNMYNVVSRFVAREGLDVEVEYVQDVDRILAYNVMATPVLVINEQVVMVGFRGPAKIEQAIREHLDGAGL
jgi:small redox-active disulfide protein 2